MNPRLQKEIRFWTIVGLLVITAACVSRYVTGLLDVVAPDISGIPVAPATWDGKYPCVVQDVGREGGEPQLTNCTIPGENSANTDRFEVDLRYGKFILRQTDLFVIDDLPIVLTRTYNSREWAHPNPVHAFGRNANHRYDIAPLGTRNPYTYQIILFEDGEYLHFPRISAGVSYGDAAFRHSESSGAYYGAIERWEHSGWTLTRADGYTVKFPDSNGATNTAQGGPYEIDGQKGGLKLKRNESRDLEEIRTEHGHFIRFQYDDQHRILNAETDGGDRRDYRYNVDGMLVDVITPSGIDRHYDYKGHLMTAVTDKRGNVLLRNEYDGDVLVGQQFLHSDPIQYGYARGPSYFARAQVKMPGQKVVTLDIARSVPESSKRLMK
jgi:hypothetical protein